MELDDNWAEDSVETPNYECPLCGAEVEESGYCGACRETMEDDDD